MTLGDSDPEFRGDTSGGRIVARLDDEQTRVEVGEVELELLLLVGWIQRSRGGARGDGDLK